MICVVDYDAGNLTSVRRALDHLGVPSRVVSTGDELQRMGSIAGGRIIFPGVGHARTAMRTLEDRGLDAALRKAYQMGIPMLGICLGAQVILSESEEGGVSCLDLIPGECRFFRPPDKSLKVPHMGWNGIRLVRPHPVLGDIRKGDEFYFVHGYYPLPNRASYVFATCEYGCEFPAVIGHGSLVAVQFHPEKSGSIGLKLLRNFLQWDGSMPPLSGREDWVGEEGWC